MPRRIGRLLMVIMLLAVTCLGAVAGDPVVVPSVRGEIIPQTANADALASAKVNAAGVVPFFIQLFATADMPPAGWQTTSFSASFYKWMTVSKAAYPEFVHSGAYAAWVNWDNTTAQDEWLYSSWFTVPVSTSATTLYFWALSSTNYLTATVTLYVEDGLNSTIAWDLADMAWPTLKYRQVTVDLSPYQGKTIRLVWRYHGVNGESFGLDDIVVTGPLRGMFIPLAMSP